MKTINESSVQNITSVVQPAIRHWSRRGFLGTCIAAVMLALFTLPASAAPTLTCNYVAAKSQGTITYTAQRAFRGGSEGKFVVNGKAFPGSAYAGTGGGLGLVWYSGATYWMAGNALITLQPDGTYSGTIWFFDRRGNQIDSGIITLR